MKVTAMIRPLIALAVFTAPSAAIAVPITIDVTGTVFAVPVYDNSATPVDNLIGTLADLSAHGTVTYDASLGPTPTVTDFSGGIYTQASEGSPLAEFIWASVSWANGTFVPAPVSAPAGATEVGDLLILHNPVFGQDQLILADAYGWQAEDLSGELSRLAFYFFDDFIANEGPPTGTEFPNLDLADAQIIVSSMVFDRIGDEYFYTGFQVGIDITSATLRPMAVPEPGTLGLLVAGVGVLGTMVGRRRARRQRNHVEGIGAS